MYPSFRNAVWPGEVWSVMCLLGKDKDKDLGLIPSTHVTAGAVGNP